MKRFFLFRYADFLKTLFLFLFIISLFFVFISFLGIVSEASAVKISVIFLIFYLLFFEFSLFFNFKIRNPEINVNLKEASQNTENYNLAEFLDLEACQTVEAAIKLCKKRKTFEINSSSLFYSAIKTSKDIKLIIFRLGLDVAKLQADLKNYLEKIQRREASTEFFSEDFKNVIKEAVSLSVERGHNKIGEKEILVGLAKHDEFFKKVLINSDLKEKDIENITLWLDLIEQAQELSFMPWSINNLAKLGSLGKDWASGFTVTLDRFSIDWRNIVSKSFFGQIIGHKKEINEVEMILAKSNLTNVLLIGDPGTGRKSIVEALAQKCYLGESLQELNNKRVVELDMVALLSQIQDPEKLETALNQIFQETLASGNVILVIENIDNYLEQEVAKPGAADISGILAKYLPLQNFQFIGITDYSGLHNKVEKNPAFLSLFQKVEVSEISESETILILQDLALGLELKNKILITYPAIREIVNLTGRYMPSTHFPKKAIDILDESAVYLRTLKEKILLPHHIAEIISNKTEIPVGKMEFKEKEVLLNLENLIHQRIVNQEEAVKEISIAMRRARAGIAGKKRPMGTFLFMGPTGVGKTETSKALAQIYFGRPSSAEASDGQREKMIRIDMSEFQQVSDIPRLIGAVSPVEQQGLLTTPVRENPFSLILLDEVEKAHRNILNLFLQVFDEGYITDGQGRKVVFTNTIIICTSNAGAETIFKEVKEAKVLDKQKLLDELFEKKIFKPEFINRFDATVIFHPLTKENLLKIAELMLGSLQKNLKEKEIDFEITEHLKEKIVVLSYKPEFGAREMRRVVQDKIENVVAEALISDKIKKGDRFQIDSETFELIINPLKE